MNEAVIPFVYDDSLVRVIDRSGDPWWVLTDVCGILAYRMASDASRRLEEDEKGTHIVRTLGGSQEMTIINESGLWSLVLTSRKPEAKRFKKWLTSEVIPSIRKTGSYRHPGIPPERDTAQWSASFARVVHAYNSEGGQEAARVIWDGAGIPFPMPCLAGVLHLMEASLGTEGLMRVSRSTSRRAVSSRHNGALGGRPRKGESAAQARSRRFYMVEKEIVPSDDGTETTVYTYSTQPKESETLDEDGFPFSEPPDRPH